MYCIHFYKLHMLTLLSYFVMCSFVLGNLHACLSLFSIYNPVQHRIKDLYIKFYILLSILRTHLLLNTRNDTLGQFVIVSPMQSIANRLAYYMIFIIYTCIRLYIL